MKAICKAILRIILWPAAKLLELVGLKADDLMFMEVHAEGLRRRT